MPRIDDKSNLSTREQEALEKYVAEHRGSTLLKGERTAKFIQRRQLVERCETPAKHSEIERDASREEKYGHADWAQFDDIAREWPDLAKPPARRPSAELWDALERFVQISASSLEDFKRRYPAFLPPWFYEVPYGNDAEPSVKTGMVAWQAWRALLRAAWHSGLHPEFVAQLVNIPTVPPGNTRFEVQPVCDAQRAVMAMALESWRARYCPKCGRPFVARKAADKYCSDECFSECRREKQRASKRYRARKHTQRNRRSGSTRR